MLMLTIFPPRRRKLNIEVLLKSPDYESNFSISVKCVSNLFYKWFLLWNEN